MKTIKKASILLLISIVFINNRPAPEWVPLKHKKAFNKTVKSAERLADILKSSNEIKCENTKKGIKLTAKRHSLYNTYYINSLNCDNISYSNSTITIKNNTISGKITDTTIAIIYISVGFLVGLFF